MKLRSVEGNPIDRLSMRKVLTNVAYAGQVAYYLRGGGSVVVGGKHPPIVDAALFTRVQEMLADRRRYMPPARPFGREAYPLSGVAVCGFDAALLLGTKASSGGRRYVRCSSAQRRGREACQQPMVRAELLEAQIAAYVGGMRLPPGYLGEVVAELRRRQRVAGVMDTAAEAGRLGRELDRWRRLFVLGEIDEEHYRHETAPLRRHLAELERPEEVLDIERAAVNR